MTTIFIPLVYGDEESTNTPTLLSNVTSASNSFLNKAVFKENEQSTIVLNSSFNDSTTNIAFYMKCPNPTCPDNGTIENPVYIFSAETLGQGNKPFNEYWAPPTFSDFIAIEYKNDNQQFTCSDKLLSGCQSDPHFVSKFEFSLVSNNTEITSAMLASKNINDDNEVNASTTSSELTALSINLSSKLITSDLQNGQVITASLDGTSSNVAATTSETGTSLALKKLSIDLSATSITSDLNDGQVVTAVLDNKPSILPEPDSSSTEASSTSPIKNFIQEVVSSIIDVFSPDSKAPENTTGTSTIKDPNVTNESSMNDPVEEIKPQNAESVPVNPLYVQPTSEVQ